MSEWRTVPSFPWLEASSEGKLRRVLPGIDGRKPRSEIIGYIMRSTGYRVATIKRGSFCRKNVGFHVMICEAFHGSKPSAAHEVAHWDGIKTNNRASNLRWATPKENAADRKRHGRDSRGNQHSKLKLIETDVLHIRRLKGLGYRGCDIAELFDLNRNHINRIAKGASWPSVAHIINGLLGFGS